MIKTAVKLSQLRVAMQKSVAMATNQKNNFTIEISDLDLGGVGAGLESIK